MKVYSKCSENVLYAAAIATAAASTAAAAAFDLKDICFSLLLGISCLTTISTARVLKIEKEYRNDTESVQVFKELSRNGPKSEFG